MSISRAGGLSVISLGQVDQLIGLLPMALTTTTTWLPFCWRTIARRAAARIFSGLATLVPPNF